MATTAVVTVTVDESGAVAGLGRLDQRAQSSFKAANAEAKQATAAIDAMGVAGTKAGDVMAAGHDKATGHALTQLDTVRLLRDDLGVRIPRAMEKLIASTQAFQSVASVAFGVFAGIGIAEIVYHLGKEVYDLERKWLSVTAAAEDYAAQQKENADKEFVNVRSIEDAKVRIDDAKQRLIEFRRVAEGAARDLKGLTWNDPLTNYVMSLGGTRQEANADSKKVVHAQGQLDLLGPEQEKLNHEKALQQVDLDHALDATLSKRRRITAELEKEKAIGVENLKYLREQNARDKNPTSKDSGVSEQQMKDKIAAAKAQADTLNLNEETQREIRRMRDETVAIGLKGEAAIYAQQKTEIDSLSTKDDAYAEKKRNIEEQTKRRIIQLHQDEAAKTRELEEQAVAAPLTGNARILEDEKRTVAAIDELVKKSELTEEEAQRRRAAAHRKANAEIAKSLGDFADAEQTMRDALESSASKGYAKIDAEDRKARDAAAARYHKVVDGMSADDARRVEAQKIYARELDDIAKDSEDKRKDVHQKNSDTLTSLQEQAQSLRTGAYQEGLRGMFAEEQSQTAKIDTEYAKRERTLRESLASGLIDQKEFAAQQSAIDDLHNAQLEEQQRNMRDKLASSIESGFKDPFGSIKAEMKHRMAEILAEWIMQLEVFKRFFGANVGSGQAGAGPGGILGSLMGHGAAGGGMMTPPTFARGTGLAAAFTGSAGTVAGSGDSPAAIRAQAASSLGALGGVPGMIAGAGSLGDPSLTAARLGLTMGPSSTVPPGDAGFAALGAASDGTDSGSAIAALSGLGGFGGGANDPMSESVGLPTPSGGSVPFGSTLPGGSSDSISGATANSGLQFAGDALGVGTAAYLGGTGIADAFKSEDPLGGAMSGAAAGAAIGSIVPGVGTVIGAGVGAVIGGASGLIGLVTGEGGKLAARDYYKQTLFPQMEDEEKAYVAGTGGDWMTALGGVNNTIFQGIQYMEHKWGRGASDWVRTHYLNKETNKVIGDITRMAKGGREYVTRSAVQFHDGGLITGFGDWATSSREGMIHAMIDETVMNPVASRNHGPVLGAMNSGASPEDVAAMYLRSSQTSRTTSSRQAAGDTHHWHVNAIDAASFEQFLDRGGMASIAKATNRRIAQYSGDGV